MPGRYRDYLERSSKYQERLEGAQEESRGLSRFSRFATVLGLGLGLYAGARYTAVGRRLLSRLGEAISPGERMTDLEKIVMERYYSVRSVKHLYRTRAIQTNIISTLSSVDIFGEAAPVLRDTAIEMMTESWAENVTLRVARDPGAFVEELTKRVDLSKYNLSPEIVAQELRRGARLRPEQLEQIVQNVKKVQSAYDDWMLRRFRARKAGGLRPVTVGDVIEGRYQLNKDVGILLRSKGEVRLKGTGAPEAILRQMAARDDRFKDLVLSAGLYIGPEGVVDLRGVKRLYERAIEGTSEFHLPFVGISPYDVFKLSLHRDASRMPHIAIIPAGSPQYIFGPRAPIGRKVPTTFSPWRTDTDLIFIGDKVYDLMNPNRPLAENISLAPSRWGLWGKTYTRVFGPTARETDIPQRGIVGWFKRTLDIGQQETHSIRERMLSIPRKFKDPDWEGNIIRQLAETDDEVSLVFNMSRLRSFVLRETKALPDDVFMEVFGKELADLFPEGIDLSTDEGVMNALGVLYNKAIGRSGGTMSEPFRATVIREWTAYTNDPFGYMNRMRTYSNKIPGIGYVGDVFSSQELIPRVHDIKKIIQLELMDEILARGGTAEQANLSDRAKEIVQRLLDRSTSANAKGMASAFILNVLPDDMSRAIILSESDNVGKTIRKFVSSRTPWYSYGSIPQTAEMLLGAETPYLLTRRAFALPSASELAEALTDPSARHAAWGKIKDFFAQFTAGRHDPTGFTSASMLSYNLTMGRLSEALSFLGIGLGPSSTGSALGIYKNLIFKRFLPISLGIGLAGYASWEIGNIFGKEGDEILADVNEGVREDLARLRDSLGITRIAKRLRQLMPGSEFIWELPGLSYFDPSKSLEEVREEDRGEYPVRRGRYWPISSGPFVGGRVMYYLPSPRRQAYADYKMTSVLYGSEEEYYANAWFPTPRFPGAPIRHFITDVYHWEKKHYRDRPYPVTGPIPELEAVPLIGPFLSSTVGRILKPPRPMHTDEVRAKLGEEQVYAINEMQKQRAEEKRYAYISPSGQVQLVEELGPAPRERIVTRRDTGSIAVATRNEREKRRAIGKRAMGGAGARAVAELNAIEKARAQDKAELLNTSFFAPARSGYQTEPYDVEPIESPTGLKYTLAKTYYSATELGGIYGFMAERVFGQPIEKMRTIETSERMLSQSRAFWDLELGGFGGEWSEIGRRFIPRMRRYKQEREINPIRNTMPSWIPEEYMGMRLREGDVYVKFPRGEARLPGGGFEALYNYYPDQMVIGLRNVSKDVKDIVTGLLHIPQGAVPESVVEAMEEGTTVHRMYQKQWKKRGILEAANEEIYDPTTRVKGYFDAVIRQGRTRRVVDIRTVTPEKLQEIALRGTPLESHIDELTIQMRATNTTRGLILYATRGETPQELQYEVKFDKERYARIYERLEQARSTIQGLIKSGEISPFELYDPLHRFQILADIAPYSEEYRYWRDYVTRQYGDLTGIIGAERREKEEIKERISTIKRRVAEAKKENRFFPYRFRTSRLRRMPVHITDVIAPGLFMTEEFPDRPIEMAGIKISMSYRSKKAMDAHAYLSKIIRPGRRLVIGVDEDEEERTQTKSINTIGAVVYAGRSNINLEMLKRGYVEPDEKDYSAAGIHARFTPGERLFGSLWERLAHLDTPFHSRFLPVRTPLEAYKRQDVYGARWKPWTIRGQVIPTLESMASKNPITAAMLGGLLGGLIYGRSTEAKLLGAKWGAAIGAGLSILRIGYELVSGERWIPARRRREREINEYFDILEYMKYRGLYEYSARRAKEEEGFDVEAFYEEVAQKRREVREERRKIQEEKRQLRLKVLKERAEDAEKIWKATDRMRKAKARQIEGIKEAKWAAVERSARRWSRVRDVMEHTREWLTEEERPSWFAERIMSFITNFGRRASERKIKARAERREERVRRRLQEELERKILDIREDTQEMDRIRELNARLEEISQNRELVELGEWSRRAVMYREAYESTLYGAVPGGNISKILSALPRKEREYFIEFMKAPVKERKEILSLVPRNERRFLQAAWGEQSEERIGLEEYFKDHYLPPPGWEGWTAQRRLEDIKVKVVRREGLEMSEFGFWEEDIKNAEQVNAPVIPIGERTYHSNEHIESAIRQILSGSGLTDISVVIEDKDLPGLDIELDIERDRREDIAQYVNDNMDVLL